MDGNKKQFQYQFDIFSFFYYGTLDGYDEFKKYHRCYRKIVIIIIEWKVERRWDTIGVAEGV